MWRAYTLEVPQVHREDGPYDALEITREDLERDLPYEIRQVLEGCGDREPEELPQEVYANFRFDLCTDCHRRSLKDPMAGVSLS